MQNKTTVEPRYIGPVGNFKFSPLCQAQVYIKAKLNEREEIRTNEHWPSYRGIFTLHRQKRGFADAA